MDYGLNVINAVPGSTRMPRFDKMLAQQTPTLSVLTQAFHQSEGHVRTGSPNRAIILSFEECNIQSPFRMGNSALNTFCRGYQYPQQQVEMDRTLRFNMKEMQSQQIWLCTTVDPNSTLVQQAFQLNWNRDYGWSFNIPFNLAEMMMRSNTTTDQHEADTIRFQVISIMEYSGTQLIQQVSTEVATWLTTMLPGLHPVCNKGRLSTQHVHFHGSKTLERLRGAPQHGEWLRETNTPEEISTYLAETNQWRMEHSYTINATEEELRYVQHQAALNRGEIEGMEESPTPRATTRADAPNSGSTS